MANSELVQLLATVEGHVQGVGFRAFVQSTAISLDLVGWVRNRTNGNVEVLAEGPRSVVEQLLIALRRGPRGSFVMGITSEWRSANGEHTTFIIRRTE